MPSTEASRLPIVDAAPPENVVWRQVQTGEPLHLDHWQVYSVLQAAVLDLVPGV